VGGRARRPNGLANPVDANPAALAGCGQRSHARGMFVVSEVKAATIRSAFEQNGELAAAVELRRLFPLITNSCRAKYVRRFSHTIGIGVRR
jgi:hypothetical protein